MFHGVVGGEICNAKYLKKKRNELAPAPRVLCPISAYGAIKSEIPLSTNASQPWVLFTSELGYPMHVMVRDRGECSRTQLLGLP